MPTPKCRSSSVGGNSNLRTIAGNNANSFQSLSMEGEVMDMDVDESCERRSRAINDADNINKQEDMEVASIVGSGVARPQNPWPMPPRRSSSAPPPSLTERKCVGARVGDNPGLLNFVARKYQAIGHTLRDLSHDVDGTVKDDIGILQSSRLVPFNGMFLDCFPRIVCFRDRARWCQLHLRAALHQLVRLIDLDRYAGPFQMLFQADRTPLSNIFCLRRIVLISWESEPTFFVCCGGVNSGDQLLGSIEGRWDAIYLAFGVVILA